MIALAAAVIGIAIVTLVLLLLVRNRYGKRLKSGLLQNGKMFHIIDVCLCCFLPTCLTMPPLSQEEANFKNHADSTVTHASELSQEKV